MSPSKILMVVDLPAPLGPRKPCTSPSATVRSSPSSARTEPKLFVRFETSMALVPLVFVMDHSSFDVGMGLPVACWAANASYIVESVIRPFV